MLGPAGQVNVDGGPHASTKVGRAGADVAEPLKHLLHIASHLHGDDAELILLVHPDKESLLFVVEDTTTFRPVTLHTSNSEVPVTRDEEEVVVNELLPDLLIHTSKGVVLSS